MGEAEAAAVVVSAFAPFDAGAWSAVFFLKI
jgi:hypothetical protein